MSKQTFIHRSLSVAGNTLSPFTKRTHDAKTFSMATELAKFVSNLPKDLRPVDAQKYTTPLREARAMQRLMFTEALKPDCKPAVLAVLARSWCFLQESIRVMRGIPQPGQLRPDLDRVQLAKMIKRAKNREPIELAPSDGKFYDDPEPLQTKSLTSEAEIPLNKPPISKSIKESLSNEGGVTGTPGGEGDEKDDGSL